VNSPEALPTIHVLLATFNGARYLQQQWASLEAQEGVEVVLHVADDGSTDDTPRLLHELAARASGAVRQVHWLDAPPRRSATRSFLLLLADAVSRQPQARWFAYCDQDDVWLPGKLAAAHAALAEFEHAERPALYGGRTLAVDEQDREAGSSPLFPRPPAFRNALVQNIMGGNTMVMNRAAAQLVAPSALADVVVHDWFTYQLVAAAGGYILYDPRPFVRYRQHGGNVIGSGLGWTARRRRLQRMLQGEFMAWNRRQVAALEARAEVLTADSREVLQAFRSARLARTPWGRTAGLRRSGVFRQTPAGNAMLWLACFLGRI
jgi:glycosyltransferase involved in cell wall biosynthesis